MSPAARITIGAAIGVVLIVAVQMLALDTNASLYLSIGEDSTANNTYVQGLLGETYVKPSLGHDGRFFFSQAQDPFITRPDTYREVIDRPLYRAQRILYPLLASPAQLIGQWVLVWWMLGINILAIAGGTYATARVAARLGLSPWFGLAFTLNPGVWAELNAGSAGALAWALAVAGLWMYLEGRLSWAVALLVGAVLAREAMLLVVAGVAYDSWRARRDIPVVLVMPVVAAVSWGVYVRWRLGASVLASQSEEFGLPFAGLIGAAREWLNESQGAHLAVGLLFVVILVRFVAIVRRVPHVVGWSTLGFALLAPFLSRQVWFRFWDITRAMVPVVTAFALLAGLEILRGSKADKTTGVGARQD